VEFKLLGSLEVHSDGRSLELGPPRQRALLAFLLLHANEVVSTDRLGDALWPNEVPKSASKAIHVYVSGLRKAFGAERDALETHGVGYRLQVASGQLDLHEFEQLLARSRGEDAAARAATLARALALWRGTALADFAYDGFAQMEVARLEEMRRLAEEERLEARLELGDGAELVGELQALVADRPLHERTRGLLMVALYRAGRQSDALAVMREGRRVLDEELGLEPGTDLRELERAILRQDPGLSPVSREPETPERGRIVVVPESASAVAALVPLAEALARSPQQRELVIARIVEADQLAEATASLGAARGGLAGRGAAVRVAAFTSATPAEDVIRLANQQDADLLLLSADGDPFAGRLAEVFDTAACDVAVLVVAGGGPAAGPVVVPFGAFEHDWAALEIAAWAASGLDRPLRVIGAADGSGGGRDASRLLADASLIVQHLTGVLAEPLLGRPGRDGVAELAVGAGLLVLGLSDRWQAEGLGETRGELVASPPAPTLVVRRGLRPSGIAPGASATRFTWSIAAPGA